MEERKDLSTRVLDYLVNDLKGSKPIHEMHYRSLFSQICEILDNDAPKSKEIQKIVDIVSQQEITEMRKKKNALDYGAIWASTIMYNLIYSEIYNQPKSDFGTVPKETDQLIKKICDEMFEINGQISPMTRRNENARTEISPLSNEQFNALFNMISEYIHYIREEFRGNHIDCEFDNYLMLDVLFQDTNVMLIWFDEVSLATWKTAFDFGAVWTATQLIWHFQKEMEYKEEIKQIKEWINQKSILNILDKICNNKFITDLEIIDWYVKEYNDLTRYEVRKLLTKLKSANVIMYFKNTYEIPEVVEERSESIIVNEIWEDNVKIGEKAYEMNDTCTMNRKWEDVVQEMIEQQKK